MSKKRPQPQHGSGRQGGAQRHRFAIKLMRPIFQTTVITVSAGSDEEAVRLALRRAARLRDQKWAGSFEPRRYQYDVQHVIDLDEWAEEDAAEGTSDADAELLGGLSRAGDGA